MNTVSKVLAALAMTVMAACGDNFEPGYRVASPRILAIAADQPYAAPGATVNLTALGHDPRGRTLEWAWITCVNPTASTPTACFAKAATDAAAGKVAFAIGPERTTFSFTVPADALSSLPRATRSAATVGVLAVACPGRISMETTPDVPVPIRCTDATGRALDLEEFDLGMKRVFVRATDRNANPAISTVTWNGAPWPETEVKEVRPCADAGSNSFGDCEGDKPRIAAELTGASFESGLDEYGVPFKESVVTQYYATDGLFESPTRLGSSTETTWGARKGASEVTLWIVARDSRGGASWTTRRVRVRG